MKTVVVLQSNYIPWKGYFDLVHDADVFIFYDDLQYTKNDWRNRNKIKTPRGAQWITIPVGTDLHRLICEVAIKDAAWQKNHWDLLKHHYGKSAYFKHYQPFFEEVYRGRQWRNLSELNQYLIRAVSNDLLSIKTEFRDSRDYGLSGHKLERLVELVTKAGATRYVSGAAAKGLHRASTVRRCEYRSSLEGLLGLPGVSAELPALRACGVRSGFTVQCGARRTLVHLGLA
jgi:hypothetical protein